MWTLLGRHIWEQGERKRERKLRERVEDHREYRSHYGRMTWKKDGTEIPTLIYCGEHAKIDWASHFELRRDVANKSSQITLQLGKGDCTPPSIGNTRRHPPQKIRTSTQVLCDWRTGHTTTLSGSIQPCRHLVELQIFLRFRCFRISNNGIFWQKTDPREQG